MNVDKWTTFDFFRSQLEISQKLQNSATGIVVVCYKLKKNQKR